MNIWDRAKRNISTKMYAVADPLPIVLPNWPAPTPLTERQYILRMMLRRPGTKLVIPPELEWIESWIQGADRNQYKVFQRKLAYCYITVRHGICTSVTDDVWHVDGFSMRKRHVPEQNYLYTDVYPTEFLDQKFAVPNDFDPLKHNIQQFFQDRANSERVWSPPPKCWVLMDPYNVHRRPFIAEGQQRTMVRITFVPIEIEDDACTPNPLLPTRVYGNKDFRLKLRQYGT